jgi:hypothetical protein
MRLRTSAFDHTIRHYKRLRSSVFVLSKAQRQAAYALFARNPSGFDSYRQFRKTLVRPMLFGAGAIQVYPWCGMFVGVERDGYTHS